MFVSRDIIFDISICQVTRVPSPAELRFHTQRIMQNALIKKQLEEQKERFIKKQQDRWVDGIYLF